MSRVYLIPALSGHLVAELVYSLWVVSEAQTAALVKSNVLTSFRLECVVQMQTVVVQSLHVDARVEERRQTSGVPRRTRRQLALCQHHQLNIIVTETAHFNERQFLTRHLYKLLLVLRFQLLYSVHTFLLSKYF